MELDAFLLHGPDAAVDDGLVEFEVGDAITQQATCGFVLVEDVDAVAHLVEGVGSSQTGGPGTDDSDALTVTDRQPWLNITLAEGAFGDGGLVLAVGRGLMVVKIQHASLLAQGRTDAPRELWEGVRRIEQSVSQFPFSFVERVVPLRRFIA